MGQPFASIVILAPLILLGACFQIAPRSSMPFQATADRQSRYTAEIMLAVKEDRRGEVSEAAANGRMVLPQLPEIWGLPPAERGPAPAALAPLGPGAASGSTPTGCASPADASADDASAAACQGGRDWALILPTLGYASIAPAGRTAGSLSGSRWSGRRASPGRLSQ